MEITNEVLLEAIDLDAQIKTMTARLASIKDAVKEAGSFATVDCVVIVSEISREYIAGKTEFLEHFKEEDLREKGLIKSLIYQSVKISKRKNP